MQLEAVYRLFRLFFRKLRIPLGENNGYDRCAVVEGIVVEGDGITLVPLAVEGGEHFVQQLPAPCAGEDQVAVLQAAAGFFHDVHRLIQPELQVGFSGEQRIVRAHDRAGPGMNRDNTVVFRDLFRKGKDFVLFRVAVRLIHETEGPAEGTAFHRFAYIAEFPLNLLRRIGGRIVAGHSRADGALADQRHQVHKQAAFGPCLEVCKTTGMLCVEQAAADFVPERRICFHAEG